ncbi:hypothetical protein CRG98_044895 [Punica granatum]|uniref:DUF1764 domain-containing protein n=1 Tax=Punica granatum TaxID=22663 RepID=A0A2I0HSN1_PUNGR|nr:hypothetical protein CRG98_044895 [Punica granatum]
MPKKKSLKTRKDSHEKPVVEATEVSPQAKEPSPLGKKPQDEIDEIFASKKRKKIEQEEEEKHKENGSLKPKKPRRKKTDRGLKENESDEPSRPRRRTNDGLAIYAEEELGINRADAGGTPLCPFDCSCCF